MELQIRYTRNVDRIRDFWTPHTHPMSLPRPCHAQMSLPRPKAPPLSRLKKRGVANDKMAVKFCALLLISVLAGAMSAPVIVKFNTTAVAAPPPPPGHECAATRPNHGNYKCIKSISLHNRRTIQAAPARGRQPVRRRLRGYPQAGRERVVSKKSQI